MSEPFCLDCPDHEACMTGYPCYVVRMVDREWRARKRAQPKRRSELGQRGRRANPDVWSICWACGVNVNHAIGHVCEASDD